MWKYVFIVLIYVITLEVWKCGCGNMFSMSLSNNSGNVEIMWKCGNMPSLSLSNNSGGLEVWKCGNMSSGSLSNNSAAKLLALLPIAVNRKTDTLLVSAHRPAAYFCSCLFGRKMDGLFVQNLTVN